MLLTCVICGNPIEDGKEVEIRGIGVMHMESTPECMSEGEREFQHDCDNLDRIRNEFSRKGWVNVDHFIWVVEKLQREWEFCPWYRHKP